LSYEATPERTLDDLVLPEQVRGACLELVEESHRADLLRSHNLVPRHRVLLAGPAGNGKTSLAESLSNALMVPLVGVRYDGLIALDAVINADFRFLNQVASRQSGHGRFSTRVPREVAEE
jgi:AAA+ superfamily predicted ATPase